MASDSFTSDALQSGVVFSIGYAGLHKRHVLPPECNASARGLLHLLISQPMLQFLEGLAAISGLVPCLNSTDGGFHEPTTGGPLAAHTHFRSNEQQQLQCQLNVIVHLSSDWDESYGGQWELWDRQMNACVKSVMPALNRCEIFNTDADSCHGVWRH